MWKDSETKCDYLSFDYLVNAVESVVLDKKLSPSTIGIYGDWGSGKSSLMQMVEDRLKGYKRTDIACIRFNGWLMEGYEDAKTTFCGTILDEMRKHKTLSASAKRMITGLLKKVDGGKLLQKVGTTALDLFVTGGIGTIPAVTVDAIVKALKGKIEGVSADDIKNVLRDIKAENKKREDIKNFRTDFQKILKESKIAHLVVFIDELDRCKPETVLEIFEAMRLFVFAEGTSFVIGADNRLIDYAIKSRYNNIPGNNLDISTEYLEKLIQYPITIPRLDSSELSRYMTCLLLENVIPDIAGIIKSVAPFCNITLETLKGHYDEKQEEEVKEALALSHQLSPILSAKQNGNPRQCKRFLNTLFMRIEMAKAKDVTLKTNVMAKLMLLEYFKPDLYAVVIDPKKKDLLAAFEEGKVSDADNQKMFDDAWVKEWGKIPVKLSSEDLRSYYYFSRGSQRVDQAFREMISPQASKCLDLLLSKTDIALNEAGKLFNQLADSEQSIVVDRLIGEMMRDDDVDVALFKSFITVIQSEKFLSEAHVYIKKIPVSKYTKGLVGQMASLLNKLSMVQNQDIYKYLKLNRDAVQAIEAVMKIINKENAR